LVIGNIATASQMEALVVVNQTGMFAQILYTSCNEGAAFTMKRRVAREIALQSLYQIGMTGVPHDEAIATSIEEAKTDNEAELSLAGGEVEPKYVHELVEGTLQGLATIDVLLEQYLTGWRMDRLSRVDREILRLAVYEMLYREDVPPKVVVNEAIDMAKHFGTEDSGKFVNGVLGKMIKELDTLKERVK